MKRTAPLIVVVATLVVGAFSVSSASAAWTKNVSTTDGKGSATSVGTPGAGSVTSKTDTTMTISWSAPSGIAPTGYEISRGGSVIATCTPSPATATTCTDTGLTASTAYSYTVKAKRNGWTGPANTAFGATTTAPSDSDAPTWSATCPTAGGHYTLGGSGTFASAGTGKCGGKVSGTVADATGI